MDKPLKRQLVKKAKVFNVSLKVMHYVLDVQYIQDDFTRYFLLFHTKRA